MSVKVDDFTPSVKAAIHMDASLSIRFMLDGIDSLSVPKTPKDTRRLSQDKLKSVQGLSGHISWEKEYAQAQEAGVTIGIKMRHYTTPGTGPHFAEDAVKSVVNGAASYFTKARLI